MKAQSLSSPDIPLVDKMAGTSSYWYLYMPVCPQMPPLCV